MVTAVLPAHAGDVIDRIVARVNGRTIFMSDWDENYVLRRCWISVRQDSSRQNSAAERSIA